MARDTLPSPIEAALAKAPSFGLPDTFQQEGRQQPTFTPGNVPFQADFNAASRKYGVPVNVLMALAQQESSFNPTALGQPTKWGRAKGLMQYLDSTASGMGINPYNPTEAIDAAAKQLKQRLDKGYSVQDAVAAHFGGDDRSQWGPKTRQYGVDVLNKAQTFFDGTQGEIKQPQPQQRDFAAEYPAAQSAMENMDQNALRSRAIETQNVLDQLNADDPGRYRALTASEASQLQQQQEDPTLDAIDKARQFQTDVDAATGQQTAIPEQMANDAEAQNKQQEKAQGFMDTAMKGARDVMDVVNTGAKDAGNLLQSGLNMAAKDSRELVSRIPFIGKPIVNAADRFDKWANGKGTEEIFKEWDESTDKAYSPALAEARKKAWVIEPGDDLGDGKKSTGYSFGPAWSDPRAYMSGILESLPEMAVTMGGSGRLASMAYKGAIARGATKEVAAKAAARTATVAGGILEGGFGGAQSARETREQIGNMTPDQLKDSVALKSLMDGGKTFEQARAELAENAASKAFLLAGVGTGIFGGMGDRAMAKIITGNAGGRLKSALVGALGEGLFEEAPQSALQQMGQNYAMQEADPNVKLMQGVANQVAGGLAIGGAMGAGMGAAAPRVAETTAQQSTPEQQVADQQAEAVQQQAVQDAATDTAPTPARDDSGLSADAGPVERAVRGTADQPSDVNGNLWAGEPGSTVTMQAKGDPSTAMNVTIERYENTGDVTVRDEVGTPYTVSPAEVDIGALPQAAEEVSTAAQSVQQVQEETAPQQAEQPVEQQQQVRQANKEGLKIDAETGEILEGKPQAVEVEAAPERQLTEMTVEELRDRMRYIAQQAKQNGGMDKRLMDARRQVEKVLNAKIRQTETDQQPASAETVTQAEPDLATTVQPDEGGIAGSGERGITDAADQPATSGRTAVSGDTATADTGPALIGGDGKPKWFSTQEKAQAFIDRRKLGDYSTVQVKPNRFEIHKVAEGEVPVAPKLDIKNPRINRTRKMVGEIGETVSPTGDVGSAKSGRAYEVTGIMPNGTVNLRDAETGEKVKVNSRDKEAAHSRNVAWNKQEPTVVETAPLQQNEQQNIPENISAPEKRDRDKYVNSRVMSQEEVNQKGDHHLSPWLFADGRIVHSNGDHVSLSDEFDNTGYRDMSLDTGAIRSTFHKATSGHPEDVSFASLQLFDDQKLTPEQYKAVESFVRANDAKILLGVDRSGKNLENVEHDEVTLSELRDHTTQQGEQSANVSGKQETASQPEKAAEYGSNNKLVSQDRAAELRQRLKAKFSQLNSGIDPEILAIGTELAVFHIEAGVRKFADFARAMAADLDLPLDRVRPYLRSWYNGARDMMEDSGVSIDGMDTAETVRAAQAKLYDQSSNQQEPQAAPQQAKQETTPPAAAQKSSTRQTNARETGGMDDMVSQFDNEVPNVSSPRTGLEPDSATARNAEPVNESVDANGSAADGRSTAAAGRGVNAERSAGQRNQRVSGDGAAAVGEPGDQRVHREDGQFRPSAGTSGADIRTGSAGRSTAGLSTERERASAVAANAHASGAGEFAQRLAAQKKAPKETKWGNAESVRASLPMLLPAQQDDVVKVEQRHQKDNGIVITNGTGTGKTMSGLGVAKRFHNAGKENILIVVPSDKIASDWVKSAGWLSMPLKQLSGINDNGGSGPVITTYANMGQNTALANRQWDLVIPDESHRLMQNESGDVTDQLRMFRALTGHPDGFSTWMQAKHADRYEKLSAAQMARDKDATENNKTASAEKRANTYTQVLNEWNALYKEEQAKWRERWEKQDNLPKAVFMSATPFAYVPNTDYAEGFLFHHVPPAERFKDRSQGGYNSGNPRDLFYIQHFGYRMRYNRLTRPEAEVNTELMEQNFNQYLKDTGALIGRSLDVPFDYDRKFILIDDAAGKKLDQALEYLNSGENGMYRNIYSAVMDTFDHQRKMFLLESMKARAAVPIIQQHLDMGRKVLVVHDYNQGGGFNPFAESLKDMDPALRPIARDLFQKPIFRINFSGLDSALNTLTAAFPNAMTFNGTVPKAKRRANADKFNDDMLGPSILIAQSDAMREGVSVHDTTGKHQRVEINLGLPTQPTKSIQLEGRIYRTGQASDAAFRYMTTGTAWEANAFASKLAERASTAENLAMGPDSRALKQSFIDAYRDAAPITASKNDGKGGKAADKRASNEISEFDKAKTYYFAQQKNSKSRDSREGVDYYATPEPVGMKMVEWANIKPGDKVLEPSAGHGAIARFFPAQSDVTMVEPSLNLSQRAALANGGARIVNGRFEDLNRTNKYDAIVMNPPYGMGGKTAYEHLDKAMQHLRDGGRIVALVPRGGMADQRFAQFMQLANENDIHLVADIAMPRSTFERAGTQVNTRVLVLEKNTNEDYQAPDVQTEDLSGADTVTDLFNEIESLSVPERASRQQQEDNLQSLRTGDSFENMGHRQRPISGDDVAALTRMRGEEGQAIPANKFAELVGRIEESQLQGKSNPEKVLETLRKAEKSGVYSKEGAQLASWLIRQYPHIANELNIELQKGGDNQPAGNYNVPNRLVSLFSDFARDGAPVRSTDAITATHEILHHMERMLPRNVQREIAKEWTQALEKRMQEYADAGDSRREHLLADLVAGMYGDREALNRARQAFTSGELPSSDYQYASPSEYWAENGARIISDRKARADAPKTWVDRAVEAMRAIINRIKVILGVKSDDPNVLMQALDSVLAGDGKFVNDSIIARTGDDMYGLSDQFGDYQSPNLQSLRSGMEPNPNIPTQEQDNARIRNWWDRLKNLPSDKMTDTMKHTLAALPLRPLAMELGKNIPSLGNYMRLKQSMDAMRNKWHAKTDDTAKKWLAYRVKHPIENTKLMDLMHESTIAQVDPSEHFEPAMTDRDRDALRTVAAGSEQELELVAKAAQDDRRRAAWGELNEQFKQLSPQAQSIFKEVRDAYTEITNEYEKTLLGNMEKAINVRIKRAEREHRADLQRITDEGLTGQEKADAQAEADKKLKVAKTKTAWNRKARVTQLRTQFEMNRLQGPYFPLARFGNLFVTVRDKASGKVESFSRFESAREQREFAQLMRENPKYTVQTGALDDSMTTRKAVDANFVADVEDILADLPNAETVKDEVWQRYLESLPDFSIRKNRIHRTNRKGFNADALRAFGNQMFHSSHQLARLKHTYDMEEALDAAREEAGKTKDPVRDGLVVNEMEKRHQYIMNPTGGALATKLTGAAFMWFLAASPTTAIRNLAQTPMIGIPVMAAYDGTTKGIPRAINQFARASADLLRGRGKVGKSGGLSADERKAIEAAYDIGLIDRTQAHDLAGIGETGIEYKPLRSTLMAAASWGFHHSERINREVTVLMGYRMARAKGLTPQQAIQAANDLTWKTHFDYQNNSRPRVMHNDMMKVALVFRNYSINMLYRLFRDMHQSVKGDTPEARREARLQLAGITGMMMLGAGITGTWGAGIIFALASAFMDDDKDPEQELKKSMVEALGPMMAGIILDGVPGYVTGTSQSESLGMPDLWFRSPSSELEGKSEFEYWQSQLLGATPSIASNVFRGFNLIKQGETYRGIETAMPKWIKDPMKAYRYATEGATNLKGDTIVDDVSTADVIRQALGSTPAKLAEQYDINNRGYNLQQGILRKRQRLMDSYAKAGDKGDTAKQQEIIDQIVDFNGKYPEQAITGKTITRSMKTRAQNAESATGGMRYNRKLRDRILEDQAPRIYE